MKVAIPHWQGRVSPVFDVASRVLVVEICDGLQRSREDVALDAEDPQRRAIQLARTGAEILICGAISWPMEAALAAAGIDVIGKTCGDVEQVLAAFATGRLQQDAFLMPGCCGQRRCFGTFGAGRRSGGRCWRRGQKGGDDDAQR